ncbi:hypothetical protein KFK09_012237 [Dendrobium nobile]|uniref:Reverse transcriptase zinc-binding domain-containing protein n=1 Tax=Dendrobium nobile TaxID=94219 RepID=A0A8T3BHB7_DENNO|nr:hypothetical protein KFK09_012237 [Dendrobium nobile]
MVSWDTVCLPKQNGGLGIPSLNALQFAFNCSVIHRMYNYSSPLSSWLSSHYTSPWRPPTPKASKFWVSVCRTAAIVKSNFNFVITPNAPISLLWDHWCNGTTLADFVDDTNLGCFSSPLLKNYISNLNWQFADEVPQHLKIAVSSLQIHESASSCLIWKDLVKSKFRDFVEDFYNSLHVCSWNKFVWHKRNSLKHAVYVWLALVGGLKTKDALKLRNIYVPAICSLCQSAPETVYHLFFEFQYSFSILNSIIPGSENFLLRPTILQLFHWLESKYAASHLSLNFMLLTVCCIIYQIWKERNCRRFGNEFKSSSTLLNSVKKVVIGKVFN